MTITTKECKIGNATRTAEQIVAGLTPWGMTITLEIKEDCKIDFSSQAAVDTLKAAISDHIYKELINHGVAEEIEQTDVYQKLRTRW